LFWLLNNKVPAGGFTICNSRDLVLTAGIASTNPGFFMLRMPLNPYGPLLPVYTGLVLSANLFIVVFMLLM